MERFREKCKIVACYINYLSGKSDEFPYTRRELKKALQAVLIAANKQARFREYVHHKKLQEQTIETSHMDEDEGFENRHLNPSFKTN